VGGKHIEIAGDEKTVGIISSLEEIFSGFIIKGSKPAFDAEFAVTCENVTIDLPVFGKEAIILKETHPFFMDKILEKVNELACESIAFLENYIAIGFYNGILVYKYHSNKAACILFQSGKEDNFLVGSLYKLLFIFLCLFMADQNRFFVHSAAICFKNKGYVFWGPSGAGKTTVAGFSNGKDVFSDDAPILFKENNCFYCAVSPFRQLYAPMGYSERKIVPIHENFFLRKAPDITMCNKSSAAVLSEIVPGHIHHFELMNRGLKRKVFEFSYDIAHESPAYDLYFTKDNLFWNLIAEPRRPKCEEMRLK
jgi:hypothetical protein